MALLLLFLFFLSTFAKPYEQLWTQDVQGQLIPSGTKMNMHEQGASLVTDLSNFVNGWLSQKGIPQRPPPTLQSKNPYPYFAFIPFYMGAVIPDGDPLTWESRCFRSVSLEAKTVATNTYNLTFTFKMHVDPLCSDFYWIATIQAGEFPSFNQAGQTVIQWTVPDNTSSAGLYDVQKSGFRVLMFAGNEEQIALDVADTVAMLEAFFLPTVPQDCADRNLYFLENYAGVKMANRSSGVVNIDESLIQDGDFFGVLRLDGVDPMLAWAMGSTTGHTATALRFNGTLHVCESTTLDAYWPVNGIQCTEYQQWVNQTNYANMNIVWSPLSSTYAAMYDAEAAYNFFTTVQGLDYGWYNLLYGWIDTLSDNYPCIPPYPSKQCLTWEVAEVLMGALERVDPPFVEEIFDQAMNLRLGTSGLDVAGILQEADIQGIPHNQLPVIVESDQFVYNTSRYGAPAQGLSMVCCVFVCEMWKHGGLFNEVNDEINCAEFTNWDDYTLAFFSKNPRPQVCVDADPNNQCCQIEGDYELNLNNYNSKSEYAHMAENCPSEAPDYQKPANC